MKKILRFLGLAIRLLSVPPIVILCCLAFAIDWFVQPAKSENTPATDRVIGLAFAIGRFVGSSSNTSTNRMDAFRFYLGSVLRIFVQIILLIFVLLLLILRIPSDIIRTVVFDPLTRLIELIGEGPMSRIDVAQKQARRDYESTL